MDIGKFEWLLSERRLYMPVAERLGDPFEGTTPEGELAWWREEAARAETEEQRQIIRENREKLSRFVQVFRGAHYVSCWHLNRHENHAMWGCYARSPESVAIRTTFATLRRCLPPFVEIGMVRYIDYAVDRLPSMNMFDYIMHKRRHFEFEQEVRAVATAVLPDPLGGAEMRENLREGVYALPIDPTQLIQAVVLHPEATPEFQRRIAGLCAAAGLPAPEASVMNRQPVF